MTKSQKVFAAFLALITIAYGGVWGVAHSRLNANCTDKSGNVIVGCVAKSVKGVFGAVVDNAGGITISHTTGDMDLNSHQAHTVGDPTSATDVANRQYVDARVIIADFATNTTLPSYAYSNGSSGVGATITYNSNVACGTFDGVTVAVQSGSGTSVVPATHMLLLNGASASDNGLYTATQLGNGSSTPCIWTRSTRADTAAKITGSKIRIKSGSRASREYSYVSTASITLGTTGLYWVDQGTNNPNDCFEFVDDFTIPTISAGTNMGPFPGLVALSGTAAAPAIAQLNDAKTVGVISCTTGTTTTGRCAITGSPNATFNEVGSIVLASTDALYMDLRLQINPLSDGTNTYTMWFGLADSIAVFTPNNAFGGMYQQSGTGADTHWQALYCASASCVKTPSANTVTAATFVRATLTKDAFDSTGHVRFDDVEAGTGNSANMPLGQAMAPMIAILKSAGTSGSLWKADWFKLKYCKPGGRGL